MSDLEKKLKAKNLKITPQRLEILRALQRVPAHPSAERVYQSVKKRYPSVSLATVYKTLETLVEIGEIRVAVVHNGKTLYDTRVDHHHHFICDSCGYVEDVDINLNCIDTCAPRGVLEKHAIDRSEVVFYGRCKSCSPLSDSSTIH